MVFLPCVVACVDHWFFFFKDFCVLSPNLFVTVIFLGASFWFSFWRAPLWGSYLWLGDHYTDRFRGTYRVTFFPSLILHIVQHVSFFANKISPFHSWFMATVVSCFQVIFWCTEINSRPQSDRAVRPMWLKMFCRALLWYLTTGYIFIILAIIVCLLI